MGWWGEAGAGSGYGGVGGLKETKHVTKYTT